MSNKQDGVNVQGAVDAGSADTANSSVHNTPLNDVLVV